MTNIHPCIADLRHRYEARQAVEEKRDDAKFEAVFTEYVLPVMQENADAGIPQVCLEEWRVAKWGVGPARFFVWLQRVGFRVDVDSVAKDEFYVTWQSGGV